MHNPSREASDHQVTGMELSSHVHVSLKAREMYLNLRERTPRITDQRLLAGIIALSDPEDIVAFWMAYPRIFDSELLQLLPHAA